jgi:YD repeat-containing protein
VMKNRFFLYVFLLFIVSTGVNSEPYHWFHPGIIVVHPNKIIGSSPGGVCNEVAEYVKAYYQQAWNVPVTVSSSLGSRNKTHAYCVVVINYSKGSRTEQHSVMRGGDECVVGAWDPREDKCIAGPTQGPPPSACGVPGATGNLAGSLTGNPINFTNGNKIQQVTDYAGSLSVPSFHRVYNSIDKKWRHSYSHRLDIFDNQNATLHLANGKTIPYDIYWTPAQPFTLDAGRLERKNNVWTYTDFDNQQFFFDTTGKFTGGLSAEGVRYTLSYEGGRITDASTQGKSISFTQAPDGQALQLTTPEQTFSYQYSDGQLTGMSSDVSAQNYVEQYHYEDARSPKLLTGITDARGVRYVTWTYDEQERAISSEHAGGADKVSISYNADGSTTVTNELGKKTTYQFKTILGVKRITSIVGEPSANCPNSNSTFTYNASGKVLTKTDNKGNITTYTYDSYGREETRTEAAGTPQARKITTYWEATFFLPSQIQEPGRVTQYRYNAQGRKISEQTTSSY